jgi:formate hydrogenlyase subunit 4
VGVLSPVLVAALFVPVFGVRPSLQTSGDLIAVIGLLALARAWLTLAGLDSGSSFGAMGTSRELAISALLEPVLMLSLVALCVAAKTTRLGEIVAFGAAHPANFYGLGWLLAALAFATAVVAETGRIPFDNPDTHLELTMVHEGMLLEYSGRSLGLLNLAAMVKQLLLCVLFVNVFIPAGMSGHGIGGTGLALFLVIVKLGAGAVALAICESSFAKMRLFQLPDLIGSAAGGAMLAVALVVLFA